MWVEIVRQYLQNLLRPRQHALVGELPPRRAAFASDD